MRKAVVMAVALASICSMAFGASSTQLSKTYRVANPDATELRTYVDTSIIIPGEHKLVGVTVVPVSGSTLSPYAAIYDATTAAEITEDSVLSEAESVAQSSGNVFYPFPKSLSKGLAIVSGPQTVVFVEYTR